MFSLITLKSSCNTVPFADICANCLTTPSKFCALPPAAATPFASCSNVLRALSALNPTDCKAIEPLTACSKSMPGASATFLSSSNSFAVSFVEYPASFIVVFMANFNASKSPAALIANAPIPTNGAVKLCSIESATPFIACAV